MAEFLITSLNSADSFSTFLKWVKSVATVCRHSVLEAALKSDPAYRPEGVSVKAGGLWPEYREMYPQPIGGPVRSSNAAWPLISGATWIRNVY